MDKSVFGGVIASILLVMYAATLGYMITVVIESGRAGSPSPINFPEGLLIVVTTVGGLVSALVISKLAVTPPMENPATRLFARKPDGTPGGFIAVLGWIYLLVWLAAGLGAFVAGVMLYPQANRTLNDVGTTWLGLAVASGYAYFGIEPTRETKLTARV